MCGPGRGLTETSLSLSERADGRRLDRCKSDTSGTASPGAGGGCVSGPPAVDGKGEAGDGEVATEPGAGPTGALDPFPFERRYSRNSLSTFIDYWIDLW